jgi:hypothetical protein
MSLSTTLLVLQLVIAGVPSDPIIACYSSGPRGYATCPAPGPIVSARLTQEYSLAPGTCVTGRTWGWYGTTLWVATGCSGMFDVVVAH